MKRAFDIVGAALMLIALAPIFILIAILIKFDSPGPIIFKQERIGKGFNPFLIYKFRTMVNDAPRLGAAITCGNDLRITRAGRIVTALTYTNASTPPPPDAIAAITQAAVARADAALLARPAR